MNRRYNIDQPGFSQYPVRVEKIGFENYNKKKSNINYVAKMPEKKPFQVLSLAKYQVKKLHNNKSNRWR